MKIKRAYYLEAGDRIRSIAELLRGKVPTNTRGLVIDTDDHGNALVEFSNKESGWVNPLDVEIYDNWGPLFSVKNALDDYGKEYWSKYLEHTGLDEQILRMAFDKVAEILDIENGLSPKDIKEAYLNLADEFKEAGGLGFIRTVRTSTIKERQNT